MIREGEKGDDPQIPPMAADFLFGKAGEAIRAERKWSGESRAPVMLMASLDEWRDSVPSSTT